MDKYLALRKDEVGEVHHRTMVRELHRVVDAWGELNVKHIGYGEVEDHLHNLKKGVGLADKTRANIRSILHDFFSWCHKRESVDRVPDMPTVKFTMAQRPTVDKPTQIAIMEEVRRISWDINSRIWFGIKVLATYIALRPDDIRRIREGDFDRERGLLFLHEPTKSTKPKEIPLTPHDVAFINGQPLATPLLPFFRHRKARKGVKVGEPFGKKYLYKWWKKACANLGIEGVDLYGGTRHSTARALREYRTPDEIREATMHRTSKAFDRYYETPGDTLRSIYADTEHGATEDVTPVKHQESKSHRDNLLKLQ